MCTYVCAHANLSPFHSLSCSFSLSLSIYIYIYIYVSRIKVSEGGRGRPESSLFNSYNTLM